MRPDRDIVLAPLLDDDAQFIERVDDLTVPRLVAHAGMTSSASHITKARLH